MNLFKKTTAAVALVTLVSGIFSTGVSAYSNAEVEAANYLAGEGVINTKATAAEYNLDQNVLRQEIAKVAVNMAADVEMKDSCDGSFADVTATTPNTWACGYVEALLDAGLVSANANFRPEDNISKSEAVKMVLEAAGYTDIYTDASNWQEEVVSFAVDAGVVSSFTNYNTMATRGFVFEAAHNAMVTMEDDSTDDLLSDLLEGLDDEETTEEMTEEDDSTEVVVSGDNVLVVELSPETPNNGFVAADRARTEVLAVEVTAGSEDVTLKEATLEYVGLSDSDDLDVLAIYLGNEKVTKGESKDFGSDNEVELTFENSTVIKAGETHTLYVTAKVASSTGTVAHKIALTDLEASSTVEMTTVNSMSFGVVNSANVASLDLDITTQNSDVTVGEVETLADFSLEEKDDREDVILKSLTFQFDNFDAEDDLSDVVLYADGEEIASDLMVNSDDEVIVDLEFVIPADEKVDFELEGVVTGSINDQLVATLTDIYAVGAETGLVVKLTGEALSTELSSSSRDIEGSEINVSFDKSDIDEARPNAEEVLVGTLSLSSVSDYTVDELTVTVTNTGVIDNLELDGMSYDSLSGLVYTFEDITLNAGEDRDLELTFDVVDNTALTGQNVEFTVSIEKVTDEENDETYTSSTTPNLSTVLSTNSLDSKIVDIESASFTLNQTKVTDRTLVLGNGIEVVLYKGKLSVGDADEVTVRDMVLTGSITSTGTYDFEDIIDSAELNIGGKTFDADVQSDRVEFNSINAVVAAGSDNVEVTVTAVLLDTDDVNEGDKFVLDTVVDTLLVLEDSEGDDLVSANVDVRNTSNTEITLNEKGSIYFVVDTNGKYKNDIDEVVLAGEDSVALAEVEIEAIDEDVEIEDLVFTATGDLSTTLENVRLVSGSSVIAEGAVIVNSGSVTTVTFENEFTVAESMEKFNALLVADLNPILTEGGEVSAVAQKVSFVLTSMDAKGASSNDDLTFTAGSTVSDEVSIVPATLTLANYSSFAEGDITAELEVNLDEGNNDLDGADVIAKEVTLVSYASLVSEIINLDNNDAVLYSSGVTGSISGNTITFGTGVDSQINDGDRLEIRLDDSTLSDGDTRLIEVKNGVDGGFVYTIDSADYNAVNDSRVSLGTFKK